MLKHMDENVKGKSYVEIRGFISEKLLDICEKAEKMYVNNEDYEKAGEVLKISKRVNEIKIQ